MLLSAHAPTLEPEHAGLLHREDLDVGVEGGGEVERLVVGVDDPQVGAEGFPMEGDRVHHLRVCGGSGATMCAGYLGSPVVG